MNTSANPIAFTSIKDDTIGGDTNADGAAASPAPADWNFILVNGGGIATLDRTITRYGGSNNITNFYNNGGALSIANSVVENSNFYGIFHVGGTTTVSQSSLKGNAGFGIFNNTIQIINAKNNWWGSATGPFHPTLNPSGTGNQVSDFVDFTPFLTSEPAGTTTVPVGVSASNLAKQLVNENYLWGGKGWDFANKLFTDTSVVKTGYQYWNPDGKQFAIGNGVDCSGLTAWAYNRIVDPTKYFTSNFIKYENANGQYKRNTQPVVESELQPGDLLFFDNLPKDGRIDHVGMYVGDQGSYNIVEARSPSLGITTSSVVAAEARPGFIAFGRPKNTTIAMSVTKRSPVHLSVTDPDGNIISDSTGIVTEEEFIRESEDLYYVTMSVDAGGYTEDIVYSPVLKQGAYRIRVSPMASSTPNQTYSLDFTAGSTTIALAQNVPLSQIPSGGYGVVVDTDNTVIVDMIPPEAHIGFSTSTKKILTTGSDDISTTSVFTNATSTIITDVAGNALALVISKNITQPNFAALVIPSFSYSTGTTTNATTSLRYFWLTDNTGKYTLLVSAIRTPTERLVSIYVPLLNKTYILEGNSNDDTANLSTQTTLLLLRKKVQTFTGMVVPHVSTNKGSVAIEF